uniref:Uncharacterized protein n=1 Tax=Meloidogyne javanica TaxID=6303 RepID=A0A915MFY8_MELJA
RPAHPRAVFVPYYTQPNFPAPFVQTLPPPVPNFPPPSVHPQPLFYFPRAPHY